MLFRSENDDNTNCIGINSTWLHRNVRKAANSQDIYDHSHDSEPEETSLQKSAKEFKLAKGKFGIGIATVKSEYI